MAADLPARQPQPLEQSIFTPLTTEKDYTKWIAGDLGLAFVVVAAVVAVAFWLKRGELTA